MTYESAVTKLMFLLGQYTDPRQVKELLETDLRGEITVS
jgi:L-asparaginase